MAMALWSHFQEYRPLIGFTNMLNLDQTRTAKAGCFLIEFSYAQVLQDLTEQNLISWASMVGHKHAVVNFMMPVGQEITSDRIHDMLAHIRKYNFQNSKGQLIVSRVMTSKVPCVYDLVTEMGLISQGDADQRVIYDYYFEKQQGGRRQEQDQVSYGAQIFIRHQTEVKVRISGANSQSRLALHSLQQALENALQAFVNKEQIPSMQVQQGSRTISLKLKNQMGGILTAEDERVAEHMCRKVLTKDCRISTRMDAQLVQLGFSSSKWVVSQTGMQKSCARAMIMDMDMDREMGPSCPGQKQDTRKDQAPAAQGAASSSNSNNGTVPGSSPSSSVHQQGSMTGSLDDFVTVPGQVKSL